MISELARRYSEATFSLFKEEELFDLQETIKEIIKLFKNDPNLISFLDNRFISRNERNEIVDKAFNKLDIRLKNLIKVVIDNNRAKYLLEIFEGINSLINEEKGIIEGIVYSAFKLNDEQLSKIEEKVSKLENRKCSLTNIIDSTLIGGIKVAISSHVYDNSIKTKIENMKTDLL